MQLKSQNVVLNLLWLRHLRRDSHTSLSGDLMPGGGEAGGTGWKKHLGDKSVPRTKGVTFCTTVLSTTSKTDMVVKNCSPRTWGTEVKRLKSLRATKEKRNTH